MSIPHPSTKSYRAAIFDLDGTLADTLRDIADSVNHVLQRHGLPPHPAESYRDMVGNGFTNLIRVAVPFSLRDDTAAVDFILNEAKEYYASHSLVATKPYPGILPMLEELARRGARLAVLSNKPDPMARAMVEALFPGIPFTAVRGEVGGMPRKPDPRAALVIAESTGLAAREWIFVGDSDVDMKTAVAAGMGALGATWGYRDSETLLAAGADLLLPAPARILDFF